MGNTDKHSVGFYSEPVDAVKKITEIFGRDILLDHRRFSAAFSDVAPRLSKENKALYLALSENLGKLFIDSENKINQKLITFEDLYKRAVSEVSDYLNSEKAEMVVCCMFAAMGWEYSPKTAETSDSPTDNGSGLYDDSADSDTGFTAENLISMAENGDMNAQFNLAERYYFGRGVVHNYAVAVHWYKKAAAQGDCRAQKALGDCYRMGQGIPMDYGIAVSWYKKAAQQGDYDSQLALVRCYQKGGHNLERDVEYAHKLSRLYGVKTYQSDPVGLIKESAENGSVHSMLRLADMLYSGNGTVCDKTAAAEWYRRASEKNNADAQFRLAKCYTDGEGVNQSFADAFYWYEKSAANGNYDAMNNLAGCYLHGNGAAKIPQKAAELYKKAAEAGNIRAQYNYGECLYNGFGVLKNHTEAFSWYKKSATKGNAQAQYSLGWCYYHGEGTAKDFNAAKRFFELASKQRNPHAQLMLGYCYLNGQGTDRNYSSAAQWFLKAANRGIAESAEMLVRCLATGGFYLSRDLDRAKKYAAKFGVELNTL